jgi:predicted amidophosphoribosyltransferase
MAPPPPLCIRCGVPLRGHGALTGLHTCGACRLRPPAFAAARGAALYEPAGVPSAVVTALLAFKYAGVRSLAGPLALLLAERLPVPRDAVLVPVPLHPARLRQRRYNQSALLAYGVARRTGRPLLLAALVRRHASPPQAGLDAAARQAARLCEVFAVRDAAALLRRRVLLIDDVITTGATADACARALLAAGANRVDVYAVCRTPLA